MNDRDRLAADLLDAEKAEENKWTSGLDPFYDRVADRLIALGWTRLHPPTTRYSPVHVHDGEWCAKCVEHGVVEEVRRGLDEERLARALQRVIDNGEALALWHEDAAAIAKAYREDTDGRP